MNTTKTKTAPKAKPLYVITTNYHGGTSIAMSSSFYRSGYATEKAARKAALDKAKDLAKQYVRDLVTSRLAPVPEDEARRRVNIETSPVSGVIVVRQYTSAACVGVHHVCYFDIEKITPV